MYSIEFKARAVVHYCEFLKSLRRVAKHYNIGKSSLARWVAAWGKRRITSHVVDAISAKIRKHSKFC